MNPIHPHDVGKQNSLVRWQGVIRLPGDDIAALTRAGLLPRRMRNPLDYLTRRVREGLGQVPKSIIDGWFFEPRPSDGQIVLAPKAASDGKDKGGGKPNLVVDSGVYISLERLAGINGPPSQLVRMGMDDGASNPVAGTEDSDTGSTNRTLAPFDSTPTRGTGGTAKQLTFVRTFTDPAGTSPDSLGRVGFVMKRLFLSNHGSNITNTTTADDAGSLYAMTNVFTIDFTSQSSWSATFSALVNGSGS